MADRKTERLVSLVMVLRATRRFLGREEIRDQVAGYEGLSDNAFQRMFERDKKELREMGIPISSGSHDPFAEAEGYLIRAGDYELPPLEFSPAESMILGAATRTWQEQAMGRSSIAALGKLRAAGLQPDVGALPMVHPSVPQAADLPLWLTAVTTRTPVTFGYRGSTRHLQPWTLAQRRGHWYVVGHDLDRSEPRTFKLARVDQAVELIGEPGSYQIDEDEAAARAQAIRPEQRDRQAVLALAPGRALELRGGTEGQLSPEVAAALPGWQRAAYTFGDVEEAAADLAGHGSAVVVLEPPELVAAVQQWLGWWAAAAGTDVGQEGRDGKGQD
ncbi:helix-turn-helix transcriptional regulator [Parenemella sanctibonifatiensis]|uniref:DNA-binding transcriptional regulator n=1 Tax=Parenemella sanctibonifatiensis TaxID=2016505 RepID=A0A255EEP9_9ACTN|nr:WYL domain-containing protein [Parenemella sanctibonifatiensis]OYN90019.1 DNA-binding transcriptional regulator [Parenemella sanctibonifatiensis]